MMSSAATGGESWRAVAQTWGILLAARRRDTADMPGVSSNRLEGGGYCRDHLRALTQRVEVAKGEVRVMRSKSRLLQALVAGGGVDAVPTQGLKWRKGWDSNPRWSCPHGGFQDRCLKPLGHPSMPVMRYITFGARARAEVYGGGVNR